MTKLVGYELGRFTLKEPSAFGAHVAKRLAVAESLHALESHSISFRTKNSGLKNDFLQLKALREEVATAIHMLLENDAQLVRSKISAEELSAAGDKFGSLKLLGKLHEDEVWTRASLNWKSFLYAVRCLQDGVFKAILRANQVEPGDYPSMSQCLSNDEWLKDSLVGRVFVARMPEYPDWFIRIRNLRNSLKSGLSVISEWKSREHFIVLYEACWEGHLIADKKGSAKRLGLDLADECLQMCVKALGLIRLEHDKTLDGKAARQQRIAKMEAEEALGLVPPRKRAKVKASDKAVKRLG